MFKDVQLSKEMMQQFRKLNDSSGAVAPVASAAVKKEAADEVQLEVNVCTTGYWPRFAPAHRAPLPDRRVVPASDVGRVSASSSVLCVCSSKVIPCKMPKDLSSACDKYKRFYLNQHSGHKLEWRFDQGQGEVVVDFSPTCRKGLVLSTYQMMVLLVFNTVKRVTYKVRHAHAHITRWAVRAVRHRPYHQLASAQQRWLHSTPYARRPLHSRGLHRPRLRS